MKRTVSVVIPTIAAGARADMLRRAIGSALAAHVIVVVNGNRYDPVLVGRLKADPSLTVIQIEEGNVSAARMRGLEEVSTPFFCFLDDDDELLPHALEARLRSLQPTDDVLVTNGSRVDRSGERPLVSMPESEINADLIGTFLRQNWFASPAGIFRTATVPRQLFDIRLRHFEWTWLFFALQAAGVRVRFTSEPTYRKYEEHDQCVSHSAEYFAAYAPFLLSLMALPLRKSQRRLIRRKYHAALNAASLSAIQAGENRKAWAAHVRCVAAGGWRYLPYTRYLLARHGSSMLTGGGVRLYLRARTARSARPARTVSRA